MGAEQLTDILTCGHINVDTVTRDMLKIKIGILAHG